MSPSGKQSLAGGLAVAAALLAVACSGHTTAPTEVDSTSATLNAIGSCDQRCHVYMRWRASGDTDWANGPFATVQGPIKNAPISRKATGLRPNTGYAYQVCGKEVTWSSFVCVGPDGSPDHSSSFTTLDERVYQQPGAATFRVPAGVTRIAVELSGAAGGGGEVIGPGVSSYSIGGRGGRVRATLAVAAGDLLRITVGGQGGRGGNGVGGSGGVGGGGPGGAGEASMVQGGGGGGASDIRTGQSLQSRLLVAGGGGGGGADFGNQPAGNPGGASGAAAPPGDCREGPNACEQIPGGGAGTATAGGAGSGKGEDGALGLGGFGGFVSGCVSGGFCFGGGGGGGGLYGGGGGANGGGVNSRYSAATGGGGGSSFVTAAALCSSVVQGVREGDGLVRIVFPAPAC